MSFTLDVAAELGIPDVLFWTTSACGFMGYAQYRRLIEKGLTPLKDKSYLTNGHLDTIIDWIPGMKGIRLRDLPSFIATTDPDDVMLNFPMVEAETAQRASAVILNTFDALEHEVLEGLSTIYPSICSIGPLQLLIPGEV
ncbi:udp-glycosyltransferase 85a2 [Quercus suber]|uniref:Udp-glycosyltransferase 85a2 n=1 Tax=Quercus suber TaxID=58331 RepID=A0AAW0M3R1_QUESU